MNDIIESFESLMNIETQVVIIFMHALTYVPIRPCLCSPKQAPLSWTSEVPLLCDCKIMKKKTKIQ